MMQQYIQNLSPNSRPQQPSPPSDNSISTSTPPHQVSRASPASTALVMSSNNINGAQPSSRQLTPNTSSSNNGTGSSSNGNTGQHGGPPNPMVRQFACHTKSMSAGVVVPIPGYPNHLNCVNQNSHIVHNNNNMGPPQPNNNMHMGASGGHHHRALPITDHNNNNGPTNNHHRGHSQQQVIREHPRSQHQQHQQHLQHQQQQQQHHQFLNAQQNHGSSGQFISARQGAGSSIILSNNNINNIHNRSHSTHLSNVVLGSQTTSNHHNHHNITHNSRNFPPHVTSSILSIDENISKSQGKLAASSSYITQSYLYNPSITDMSCDNVSNASRLIDGAPAPGYYLHAANNLPNANALSASGTIKTPEFLPICDLMFNLISMIIYFCENTFGIIALIALHYHMISRNWAIVGAVFIVASNLICQYLSFKWLYKNKLEECRNKREAQEELEDEEDCERRYYNRMAANMRDYQCGSCTWLPDSATEVQLKFLLAILLDAIMHLFCLGFLMRYIRLVIPITDTGRVKKEARDLCMLRIIHGFVQSAPLLLLQSYMIFSQTCSASSTNLSITSAILSLINVCWALASFTKYARKKYMHKFVLTWLGIVSQMLWRLGTISSRVVALTIYAVYYNYCMLIVLSLHWIAMFFWFMKPGNLFRDETSIAPVKKVSYAAGIAWIHCFCYMNFEEQNSRTKMVFYYLIVFIENNVLLTVCLIFFSQNQWLKNLSLLIVYLGFVFGMLFMVLYYKYFHVSVLNNGLSRSQDSIDSIADQLSAAGKKIAGFKPGTLRLKSEDSLTSSHKYNSNIGVNLHTGSHPEIATRTMKSSYLTPSQTHMPQPGLYNCKSNLQKQQNSHILRHH